MSVAGLGWDVAVDPMVNGRASLPVVAAALGLADEGRGTPWLVGPLDELRAALVELDRSPDALEMVAAPDEVRAGEDAAVVRGRAAASVRVALDLLAEGTVHAVRSCARPDVLLTAATFRLGSQAPEALGDAGPLVRGAHAGVAVQLALDTGSLQVIDAGVADRATPVDVVGRLLELALPGSRVGLLDPMGRGGAWVDQVMALAAAVGLDVRALQASDALAGEVDLLGCTPETGVLMVQLARFFGVATSGVAVVTGVAGDVAALEPSQPVTLAPRRTVAAAR